MDKISIYQSLIDRIDANEVFCLCPSLAPHVGGGFVLSRDFPEISTQKPKTSHIGPWFPVNKSGMQKRKQILTNAINQIKNI